MSLIKHIAPVKHPGSLLHLLFCLLMLTEAFHPCYNVSLKIYRNTNCLCCLLQQTLAHQNSDITTWLAEGGAGVWKSSLPFWWAISSKNEPETSFICSVVYQENLALFTPFSSVHHGNGNDLVNMEVKRKIKTKKIRAVFRLTEMRIYWSRWWWMFSKIFVLYASIFWKHWNRGYIHIKEFNRYPEVCIIFNFYFNPSILLNIYKILCQQGPQFSYILLGIVFLFRVLYALTPNNNILCPLLLDCGKQQLIISFSLSLHNMWIVCILMVPVICPGSQEFSVSLLSPCTAVILTFLMKLSLCSMPFSTGPFLAQNEKSSSQESGWLCTTAACSSLIGVPV